MLTTIRQALYLMGREQRRRWVLLLLLAVVTSLLEIVSATLVYLLVALVANSDGAVSLPLIGDIRSYAGGLDRTTLLLVLCGFMLGFFLIRAGVSITAEYVMARMTENAAARLSRRLVAGYLAMPYPFHLNRHSSELIRNSHQATLDIATAVFSPLIRAASETILALGLLALLLTVSPIGAVLAILVVGGASALLLAVIQPRLKRYSITTWALDKETLGSLQQSYEGVRDIKLLGREGSFARTYGHARSRLARMLYTRTALLTVPRLILETSLIWFIIVFFMIALATGSDARAALSTLGLFAYAGLRLQPSLTRVVYGFTSVKFSGALTAALRDDLRTIEEQPSEQEPVRPLPFETELQLEHVSFSYEGRTAEAVADVDLVIRRGEQIGICGSTGGGKTTLVDLITGLLPATSGRVLADGADIAEDLRGWQRNIGMVSQVVFLTDDTLRRNIALGVDDDDVDEAVVAEAVKVARLEELVASLPDGLDTVVGERGARISGGERQRIAIARALYHRPQVLIFDEGTSALDNLTEQSLMRSLRELRGSHTILLVAHRLSTVREADRVVFMQDGRVAGVGTFQELFERCDAFRRMAEAG